MLLWINKKPNVVQNDFSVYVPYSTHLIEFIIGTEISSLEVFAIVGSPSPHLPPPKKKVAFGRFLLTGKINFSRNIFVASFLAPKFLKPFQKNCKTISWDSIISVNNNEISLHPVIVINNYIIILSVAKETHLTIFRICLVEFIFIMLFAFFFSFRFRFMVCNHEIEAAKRSIKMH